MSVLRRLALPVLAVAVASILGAQGYETKFKATGFKPGDIYHTDEGVNVSLTGGGLEVEIPLGPALPGPIPIRPIVHYHGKYSQTLNPSWSYGQASQDGMIGRDWSQGQVDAYEKAYRRWSPPSLPFGEAHPGHLLFRAGSTASTTSSTEPDLTLQSPFGGSTSYYLGMPGTYTFASGNKKDISELDDLAGTMAPEWDRSAKGLSGPSCAALPGTPETAALGTAIGVRLSGGTTLIFGPSEDRIFRRWTASVSPITSELLRVPREILQVDKDRVTLWRRSRNVYHHDWNPKDVNGTLADYRWTQSVYHPVWIKTRSGFRVDITIYREAPKGHMACLSDGGILTGYRVALHEHETWFQVGSAPDAGPSPSVTFNGMDVAAADGGHFEGRTPPRPLGSDSTSLGDFQPGTSLGYDSSSPDPFYWDLEYTSASLRFTGDAITYGGLTTAFEWGGPQGQLSRMTTPSGKTYAFTHQLFQGVGTNPRSAVSGISWLWNPATPSALDFYSMVTRMDVLENSTGSAQTRSTTYRWKLPAVDSGSPLGVLRWASPSQGVAQTLPTGETILHVFSSPMDGGGASTLELEGRTLLATRQAVSARYRYASGDSSWEAFFTRGSDPASTTWYARERFEGWDLRSWEARLLEAKGPNPVYLNTNTEPRATRTIREERGGPVEVTELDGWDADLGNYAVKRTYILAAGAAPTPQFWAPGAMQGLNAPLTPGQASYTRRPGLDEPAPTGALFHQVSKTTYTPDTRAALLDREEGVETKVLLAPATGATGYASRSRQTYDSGERAHIVVQSDQLDLRGGTDALSLRFDQRPLGLFKVNQLMGVTLDSSPAGAPLSGQVGATYGYDPSGRFMTSIEQRGAGWQEREPDHDPMGRPLTHLDPNGLATRYTWDNLGRLTGVAPEPPESTTAIAPENTLRKTVVTRGAQVLVYHYNGFGELVGEERTGPGGQVSHKLHGYDAGGRKAFETVWRNGPVTDLTEWARPKTGGEGVTSWTYDGRGRVLRAVNANGEITDTDYPTPLESRRSVHPDVEGAPSLVTTTFEKDILGRLAKVTDAKGQTTSYAYDASGRIRQVQQERQLRTWAYDPFGRLERLSQPESGITRYGGFTVTGKPTWTTYGDGSAAPRTVSTTFDPLSRPLTVSSSDGTIDQVFSYDGAPAGGRYEFGKALGQLSYNRDGGVERWYAYHGLNGRLGALDTRVADGATPGGAAQVFRQAFGYATDGLRQSASVDGRTQTLRLDEASRLPLGILHSRPDGYGLTVATFIQDGLLWAPTRIDFGNGASTTLGYRPDQTGLGHLSHALADGGTRAAWTYQYDGAGWLKGDGQDSYRYDALGRLNQAEVRRVDGLQVITQKLTYDAVGNLLSSLSTSNAGPLPATLNPFAFPSDAAELAQRNQLPAAQTGAQYDSQGNLTYLWKTSSASGSFLRMGYDALGRVTSLYDSATGLQEAYAYTPEGLRTRVDVFSGSLLLKTRYKVYNDQRQLVSEYEVLRAEVPGQPLGLKQAAPAGGVGSRPRARKARAATGQKKALTLGEGESAGAARVSSPRIRFRNNDGTFPKPTPSLIDNNGPAGAYITYPIGPITTTLGASVSFTGATDAGTDYLWDFGDGTPPVMGTFEAGSRTTPTVTHVFNTLSAPAFSVTLTVRNTAGGFTQSSATLEVSVVMPALPVIQAFTANGLTDTATVHWGEGATLAWDVAGATSLSISPDLGPVGPVTKGSVDVPNLQATVTYVLTATNAAGSVSQGVRIRVLPKVQSFTAAANPISAGSGTTLDWNVAGATALSLQEGSAPPLEVTGTISRPVAPLAPTAYALTASNADGTSAPAVLSLTVIPVISTFTATPDTLTPGQASTLSWTTVGTDLSLSMEPSPGPVTGSSLVVTPTTTTTYRLTATNGVASTSLAVTVVVDGLPFISAQPASQGVLAGQTATFQVGASGPGPLSYQWFRNRTPIAGATEATYTTPPVTLADHGASFGVAVSNPYGSLLSQAALLSVASDLTAPKVTASETGSSGILLFEATATDDVGITRVEFLVDGQLMGTVAAAPYRLSLDAPFLSEGPHTLVAKAYDPSGNQGSSPAVAFTISPSGGSAPTIQTQPTGQTIAAGQTATFTVVASGPGALSYQWYSQPPGASPTFPLAGATGPSYTTPPASQADDGTSYAVTITNAYGSVTSAPALLTVQSAPKIGALVWKRDIVYAGTREVGEVDAEGLHVTQVDHLGSPRLLSDRNGRLEDEQKYMPFGEHLDGLQKAAKGFTGHEQTDASGLIYMQARFFAPMWGRFLSPDSARDQHFEETQSWNIYSYCQNNPTMKIDPDGMKDDWYTAIAEKKAAGASGGSGASSGRAGTVVWKGRVYKSSDLIVRAVNPGTVTDARVMRGYGPTVDIHPDGRPENERDRSGHLSPNIPVVPGQHVEAGQEIGTVGVPPPGTTTGPHLHQEKIPDINNPKATIDPMPDAQRALPGSIPRDKHGPRIHPKTGKLQDHTGQDLQPKWKPVQRKEGKI